MKRREFLAASIAASATAIAGKMESQPAPPREFYQIRRYQLQSGPQLALTQSYFAHALIPALARMGMGPVGAMQLTFGPDTPVYYLIIPGSSAAALAELDLTLSRGCRLPENSGAFLGCDCGSSGFSARGELAARRL